LVKRPSVSWFLRFRFCGRCRNLELTTTNTIISFIAAAYVDHPIWWHIMGIAIPTQIDYLDFGILWIGDGNNDDVDIMW